jgi:hypothetical protein
MNKENSIPPEYQVKPQPFQPPYQPPTIPPPQESLDENYQRKLSQLYKYPVMERSPYGGMPYSYYTSPQIYSEYSPFFG